MPSLVPITEQDKMELSVALEIAEGETIVNPEECAVRALVYEDMVSAGATFNHVVRVVPIELPLSISESGQTVTITEEIDLDPSWKQEDLFVVAWVQRDTNQSILNAAVRMITDPTPTQSATWGSLKAGFRSTQP